MKKILVIRNSWRQDDFGGAERFALDITTGLANKYHATLVSGSHELIRRAKQEKVPHITGPRNPFQHFSSLKVLGLPVFYVGLLFSTFRYKKIMQSERPDVVHVTSRDDYISASKAAKSVGAVVIWTDHAELKSILQNQHKKFKGLPGKLVVRQMKFADKMVFVSESDMREVTSIIQSKAKDKFVVIHNGVKDLIEKKPKSRYTFVFASRLNKEKGIDELIEAYSRLKKTYPEISLLVSSDDAQSAQLRKLLRQRNVTDVTINSYDDLDIGRGKIFVLPSYMEGSSLALIKACMFAMPIISTSVGGTKEIISSRKNGLLISPMDTEELLQAMQTLLEDKNLRKTISSGARKTYQTSYTLQQMVFAGYVPLYKSSRGATGDSIKSSV